MATKTSPSKTASKTPAKPAKADAKTGKSSAKDVKPEGRSSKVAPPPSKSGRAETKAEKAETKADKTALSRESIDKLPKTGDESRSAAATKEEPLTLPRIQAATPVAEERVSVTTTMSKAQLDRFRKLLEEKRDDIIKKAKETLEEDMTLDTNDLPDEMDLASSEYLQSFTFRLRGREKSFLDKINKALERIDNQTFGVCEECADEISVKRLEARPETTLCIRCKEDQERAEKDYG
jgi:DnaK suppressor protein